ncbi:MAG: hypothetical protein JJ863_19205 [Deltaproteobacteria bacterium]|nr:hypothetical protein [Deltaproteobacteria bacterium]
MRSWAVELTLVLALSASAVRAQPTREPSVGEQRLAQETEREGVPEATHREPAPEREVVGEPTRPERAVPNYDGREPAPPSAGRRLLWIPRILLFPLWVVTEFVLRRPLSALTRWAEERAANTPSEKSPLRFLVFDEGRVQLIPTLLIDFGNQPSVGFYIRWNEAGHPNHQLRFHFAFWGPDWVKGRVTTRWEPPDGNMRAELRLSAQRRADGRFAGLGSEARPDRGARYDWREMHALASFEVEPWRQSFFMVGAGVLDERFGNDGFCCPTIEERVAEGVYGQLPPAYLDGFTAFHVDTDLHLDTRKDRGEGSSGVSLRLHGRYAVDLQAPDARRWLRFGGTLGAHWDASGHAHILSLLVGVQGAHAIEGQVPFTQQVELSGRGAMRGFRPGALMGSTGATLTLIYQWPIWGDWLDARAHVSFGNVYDGRFEQFALDRQRMSFGIGIGAVDELDHYLDFTLAWGTETFEQGFQVQSFRLALGGEWSI